MMKNNILNHEGKMNMSCVFLVIISFSDLIIMIIDFSFLESVQEKTSQRSLREEESYLFFFIFYLCRKKFLQVLG